MIITCGQCQAKFKVAPEQIKETGSKVRCSNCQYVFTVYRPKRPAETAPPVSSVSSDDYAGGGTGLDGYYPSPGADSSSTRNSGHGSDDFYGDRTEGVDRSGYDDGDYDEDDYLDADDRPSDDPASMKERRDRRRRLYSDLEDSADDSGFDDDPLDDVYDESDIDDSHGGIPPLRRNRARLSSMAQESEAEDYGDDFEEDPDEFDPENIRDTSPAGGDHGLGADPVDFGSTDAASKPDPFARLAAGYHADEGNGIRAAITKTKKKSKLLAVLALVAALLAVGIYFLTSGSQKDALIADGVPVEEEGSDQVQTSNTPRSPEDPNGTLHIGFTENAQNYFYFKNKHVGNILVLTGKVRNNYSEPRSFIKLRGHLLATDERTLADRFAFAGNMLREDELTDLTMSEISSRLMFKGGQDNINMNVPPEGEIPFMMVFDNVPDGTDQYRIDAVGSDPAQ